MGSFTLYEEIGYLISASWITCGKSVHMLILNDYSLICF